MASLTAANVLQNNFAKFAHKAMREVMKYLSTYPCASSGIATASTTSIDDTSAILAMVNGQPVQVALAAAKNLSGDTEGTETAWTTGQSYAVGSIYSYDMPSGENVRFRVIVAHTSSATNSPDSETADTYWEYAPHGAVNASGTSITTLYDQWFLVTKKVDGTMNMWEAGDEASAGTAECKIPQIDTKVYIPVAFMHVANGSGSAFVIGTTDWATGSVTETILDIVGPVLPHEDNWDAN